MVLSIQIVNAWEPTVSISGNYLYFKMYFLQARMDTPHVIMESLNLLVGFDKIGLLYSLKRIKASARQ